MTVTRATPMLAAFPSKVHRPLYARVGSLLAPQFGADEHRLIFSHLDDSDLAAIACTGHTVATLVTEERLRRQRLRIKADAAARRAKRLARARFFSEAESDARLIACVIRHVLTHAPPSYASAETLDSEPRLTASDAPSGVCRLRVGAQGAGGSASGAPPAVDVLAMQESALREVVFCGEPLGAAGAAVAARQATRLGLCAEPKTSYHGHVFRLFLRADVVVKVLGSSPSLQKLVAAKEEVVE